MERSRYLRCGAAEGSITGFALSSVVWKWDESFRNCIQLLWANVKESSRKIKVMTKNADIEKLRWVHYAMPAFASLSTSNSWPLPKSFKVPRTTNRLDLSDREPRGTWSIASAAVVKQGQTDRNAPTKLNLIAPPPRLSRTAPMKWNYEKFVLEFQDLYLVALKTRLSARG